LFESKNKIQYNKFFILKNKNVLSLKWRGDRGWVIRNRQELQIQKMFIDKIKLHKNRLFE